MRVLGADDLQVPPRERSLTSVFLFWGLIRAALPLGGAAASPICGKTERQSCGLESPHGRSRSTLLRSSWQPTLAAGCRLPRAGTTGRGFGRGRRNRPESDGPVSIATSPGRLRQYRDGNRHRLLSPSATSRRQKLRPTTIAKPSRNLSTDSHQRVSGDCRRGSRPQFRSGLHRRSADPSPSSVAQTTQPARSARWIRAGGTSAARQTGRPACRPADSRSARGRCGT